MNVTIASVPSPSAAPDWSLVPFGVECGRCGANLKGRSEPVCPACGLQFDWAQAVPIEQLRCRSCGYTLFGLIEQRCPECGTAFTWESALADYHRQRKPLFEYRWRTEPLRSFLRTWWWSLWPKSFWKRVDLHDPPRIGPLLVTMVCWLLMFGALVFAMYCIDAATLTIRSFGDPNNSSVLRDFPAIFTGVFVTRFLDHFAWYSRFAVRAVEASVVIVSMCWLGTFSALLVFRQSMRQCRIRGAHVLRACLYALGPVPFVLLPVGFCVLDDTIWSATHVELKVALLATTYLIWAVRSLTLAYRDYLHMPHSIAIAGAAQVMAGLAVMVVALWVWMWL